MQPSSRSHCGPECGETGEGSLPSTTRSSTLGSRMILRSRSTVPSTVSPTATRMLAFARAVAARTLAPALPSSVVMATVVRVIALVSLPIRPKSRVTGARNSDSLANTARSGAGACGPKRRSISAVTSGSDCGKGLRSIRVMARASRAVAPIRGGVEAWPPGSRVSSSTSRIPFSATPTTAAGRVTPGNAPPATAPPSSSTSQGRTPRPASSSAAAAALAPAVSSLLPKEK